MHFPLNDCSLVLMFRLADVMVSSQGGFRTFLFDKQNICQLRHQVDVIVFSQGVVVPEIASRFTHWELRQARRLQIADTPRHSADNKDYTDYTGLQGAAVLLLLLLHRMTGSIYTIPTGQICREFAMLWETHCVSCVNMHFMCNLHYFMCNLHYFMRNLHYAHRSRCILRRAVRIPRDPTAVTLSGCDDRWTRVELDLTPADTLFLVTDNSDGKS